jgi:RHS repeat-associated protein
MSGNASRGSARRRRQPRALRLVAVAAMVLVLAEPLPATAGVFAGALDSTLTQPPVLGPGQPVPSVVDGLLYGDPTEGVSLIDVPKPDNVGEAHTSFPVDIPPGRLEWQPEVGFEYGSRQGNGWLGVGWDAGAPSISVDTRWGVPRYDRTVESETYSFEGEQLSPTAHRSPQLAREGERIFTKRVEGDYQRIQRHGDSPDTYWWEVHDKVGNKYFYGRTPDGDVPEAILRADGNAAYWWGLVEKHDISLNTVTYFYDRVEDSGVGEGNSGPKGAQLYLARINYSGSLDTDDDDGPNLPRFGPYDVTFTRDAELGQPRRPDVTIDARTGALRVTSQLLQQVDVTFCNGRNSLNPLQCVGNPELVRSYRLNYDRGPFDKSRLRSVGQAGADGNVFATTEFDYFEDILVNGSYKAFADKTEWNTGQGDRVEGALDDVRPTALGGTSTSMGDGRVYLGFNPLNPDKSFSIGGGLEMNGSDSTSKIELVDLNGDSLPDKVWKERGTIYWRENQGGPGGTEVFSDRRAMNSLPGLPEEESFGVSIGPEAYFFVGDAMYHHGWSFNKARSYFSDVNGDGMIDFVDNGTIYFNRLDTNKQPFFAPTSAGTAVPITDQSISSAVNVDDSAYEAAARQRFPLQDTLRRWIAPWDGTVAINAPAVLRNAADSPDGVRVAIQKNGGELWSATIPKGATGPRVPDIGSVPVAKGDRIYFRLQSVDDGAADAVDWDPIVTYTNLEPALDANGLDVSRFVASEEFTLGGRTGIFTQMPLDGTVRLTGIVRKTAATTDDIRIVVEHNGTNLVASTPPIGWDQVGDFPVNVEFPVLAPRTGPHCPQENPQCVIDSLSLRLGIDSPVDVTALKWLGPAGSAGPQLFYVAATKDGKPATTHDPSGEPIIQLRPPYDISLYGQSNRSTPQGVWTVPDDGDTTPGEVRTIDVKAEVRLTGPIDVSLLPSTVAFTVKGESRRVGKGILNLPVPLPPPPGPNPAPTFVGDSLELRFQATEGQRFWFDYSSPDPRLGPLMVTDTHADVSGDDIPPAGVPAAHHWPLLLVHDDQGDIFPQPFRGWGYAGYNGDGSRAGQAVAEADLVFRRSEFEEGVENRPRSADDPNPIQGKAYPYAPDPEQDRWQGPKQSVRTDDQDPTPRPNIRGATWGAAGGSSASRVGPDSVKADGGGGSTGRAPTISGRAEEDSLGGGLAIGPLGFGGGVAVGFSRGMRDFMDMNGDGYPDVVGSKVQYTTQVGGLDPEVRDLGSSEVRMDRNLSTSASGSGTTPSIKSSPNGDTSSASSEDGGGIPGNAGGKDGDGGSSDAGGKNGKGKSGPKKGQSSSADAPGNGPSGGGGDNADTAGGEEPGEMSSGVSLGFSFDLGYTETNKDGDGYEILPFTPGNPVESDLADLNGDGLPDRVTVDGGKIEVRWNLGYRFSAPTEFPGGAIEEGKGNSYALGASVGFNAGRFDFSGGVTFQNEVEHADIAWIDINGDGLPDRLQSEHRGEGQAAERTGVRVQFNTGAGLTARVDFDDVLDHDISRSESFGISGGADFTIGIGPLCWPVRLCYIILNPGGHGGRSISAPRASLVDMDGDGLPDSVTSSDDSEMKVARNRTGRTNMLKSIRRPLGARVDLDYERDGNTVDQPFSVWTLNKVTVFDGHAGDGVDDTVTRYDYSDDNYFDFTEREMLGYGTIIEENLDDKGAVYRKFVRTYLNGNYYERGLLDSETLQDGAGTAFVSTVNTYELVDSASPEAPVSPTSTVASIFPRKVKVEEIWHGAGGAPAAKSEIRTTYDARGNAVEIVDLGGPGAGDDAVARTSFTECRTSHADSFPWTQVPLALTIVNAGGQVLRKRDSVSPCDYAAITSMEEHLSAGGDGARARTDVEYADPGGEVNLVIGPENARGDREEMSYVYDRLTGNLLSIAERGLDLETTLTWDNRFGRLASVTDPNGAVTSFTYDPQGRLTSVTEPLEQGAQPPRPTVTFSYSDTGPDPWVHAEHFDAANPNNKIGTIRFVDGVGKEIQTKADATVYDGEQKKAFDVRVVSGSTYFDFLGRPVRQFYPITEPFSVDIDEFNFNDDSVTPTLVEYDVRDRVTKVTAPGPQGDRVTETTYGFDAGLATTLVVDPELKRTVTSTDVRGNDVGVERFYAGTFLSTRFEYDPLRQLVGITEPGGARTNVGYDLLGRQVSVETPDAGKVEMGFDLASNMVSKVTPNLRGAGKQVTYEHEFNRLVAVRYPNDPSNDVTYAYGRGGAPGNTAGRIAQMVDGARTQDRAYDKAGNLVSQRDLMKVHNLSPTTAAAHTYTTKFAADSMGRILSMTYPDGEVVTNAYDSGGRIRSVAGKKGSDSYRYVDRLEYDKFGFRRLLAYGNGVSTETSYDRLTTWMSGQVVTEGSERLQNLSYTYDKVGNPRTRVDDIPVPKANEMGGPSTQTFSYDDLHRLTDATGTYDFPAKKRRDFTLALTYDGAGRVATKKQIDRIDGREQREATFDLGYAYDAGPAHGPSKVGSRTYTWDANGNNTGWAEDQGGQRRTITWDEEDRASSIADQGNTTTYRYDDDGTLALERGPQGELEYVNRYYTVVNGAVAWKQFFAGDLQVATKEVKANATEQKRYFLTGDLIGSVNLVTEADGDVFEHLEYFPGGQIWVREKSEVYRQPTLYAGLYHDEFRNLYRTQARWYEPRDGVLLSPDPMLTGSPGASVVEPRLLGAYTYSFDNPTRFVDRSGKAPLEAWTSFINGDVPVPFGVKRTMARRTDFEKSHPKFAKWFGTELDGNKTKGKFFKVTDFLDEMYSIEVGIGPKGLKLKRVGLFKKVPKFKGARAFLVRKML